MIEEMAESTYPWIGIDLGTAYTKAMIWDPKTDLVTQWVSPEGEVTMPTKVAFENFK